MRLTIDLDKSNPVSLAISIIKGTILCRKLPKVIRRSPSKHGWHLIWYNVDIDEKTSYIHRKVIGDDPKRIMMDMVYGNRRRQKQILFTKKIYKVYTPDGVFIFNQFQKKKIFELQKKYYQDRKAQTVNHSSHNPQLG